MVSFKALKNIFRHADLFYTSQLLKYRNDNNYKTLTGAIVSLALTVAILIGFSSMIISMFKKTSIESNLESSKKQDPEYMKLSSAGNNFMFAIAVKTIDYQYLDLINGPQIFDIKLANLVFINQIQTPVQEMILQQCTRQHWKTMPNVVKNFDSLDMGKMLCPPLNFRVQLEGIAASDKVTFTEIYIKNCTNSTLNGNKCAPQEQIENFYNQYRNFYLTFSFINHIINPSHPKHIKYYLQLRNQFIFSSGTGGQMNIEFADYQINTDGTILPFQSIETQKGYIVEDVSKVISYSLTPGQVISSVFLVKSSNTLTYTRTVLKISAVISYVGGLIGALISVLFLLKSHTQFSFDMALCTDLFIQKSGENKGDQIKKQKKKKFEFGLFKILKFYFYRIKFFFTKDYGNEGELMKKMERCQKQILKQLDIKVLLQRLIKLEQCICFLFDEAQIAGLKHLQQVTLQRAQFLRNKLHGTDQMQSQNQEENESQKPEAQGNAQNAEGNIVQQNEIKNKAQGYPQQIQFSSYNKDQQSVEAMKKQQLENKEYIIPVHYMEKDHQQVIQPQSSAGMRKKTQNNKKLKILKQLGQNVNNSVVKQKIWSNLKVDIKKSVKQLMLDDQLQNISCNQVSQKLEKQMME